MDRLPAVGARAGLLAVALAAAAAGGAGCRDEAGSAPESRAARVDVVKASGDGASGAAGATGGGAAARAAAAKAAKELCDVAYAPGAGPALELPPSVPARAGGPGVPALPQGRWVWVNLWATWCDPCLEEMPLLRRWQEQMTRAGTSWDLWLVSVDVGPEELEEFLAGKPELRGQASVRLESPALLGPWVQKLGGPAEASVPVQVLVGPEGKVRCVRAGGIGDPHLPLVRAILAER